MLTSKKNTLKPLLESADGVHLTAYMVNRGDLIDLKMQLRDAITQSHEWLNPVMSPEQRDKFLEPLESLLHDARIFKQIKGNIGIFRNQDSFRILNVPIQVEQMCQVATSFHVKPLLKWLQNDQDFLLLGLTKDFAQLYLGSQTVFRLVDSILLPSCYDDKNNVSINLSIDNSKKIKAQPDEVFTWISDWISELTKSSKPKLFLAGEKNLLDGLKRKLRYSNTVKTPVSLAFTQDNTGDICQLIRKILKDESRKQLEKSLLEFRFAEEGNRARKNIFQISKAVVRGQVRKLIVTDELSIFGKIDKKSGGLAIHPFDLDHEDDDILDDLAQMVLSQGGEVVIASRDEIPKGRPILAILDDDSKDLEKSDILDEHNYIKEGIT